MIEVESIARQYSGLYHVIPLDILRRTPGVSFDLVPVEALPRIDGIDRVIHDGGAISPGSVDDVLRPWYMHPHQDTNSVGEIIKGRSGRSNEAVELERLRHKRSK